MLLRVSLMLAMTVCFRTAAFSNYLRLNNADKELHTAMEKVFTWLSSADFGYVATRSTADVDKTSKDALAKALKTMFEDLTCSYVFSAQLHMHLTKIFVVNPSKLDELTEAQVNNLVFTDEVATMLAVVYDYGTGMGDNRTTLMHILHMYTKRAAEFMVKVHRDGYSNLSYEREMMSTHQAVEELLGDFIAINNCQMYGSPTGNIINNNTWFAKKVEQTLLKGPSATMEAVVKNKTRFQQQTDHNAAQNLVAENRDRFAGDRLLINRLLDKRQAIDNLRSAFGVQLDWDVLVRHLKYSYDLAKIDDNMLHERIKALTTFQHEFEDLLKAIAIRIVIKHLLNVKETLTKVPLYSLDVFFVYYCGYYNRKIADHLTALAVHLDFIDDRQLRPAIDLMRSFKGNFITVNRIDGHVNDLMESLKTIPSANSEDFKFDAIMTVDETSNKRSMKAVDKLVKKYNLEVSPQDSFYSVGESVFIAEAFAKFVKKITEKVDIKMFKLFGKITKSTEYRRLKNWKLLTQMTNKKLKVL